MLQCGQEPCKGNLYVESRLIDEKPVKISHVARGEYSVGVENVLASSLLVLGWFMDKAK